MAFKDLRLAALLLLAAAATAPPAAADGPAGPVELRGTLEVAHSDDFRHGRARYSYALRIGAGSVRLRFRGRGPAGLGGARVAVRGQALGGAVRVREVRVAKRRPSTRLSLFGVTGARKVAVILFNFTNNPAQPFTPEQARQTVFTGAGSVNAFEQEQSFGRISLTGKLRADGDVFGWYQIPYDGSGCQFWAWSSAARSAAQAAGIDLSGYDHFVYAFPYSSSCAWAGLGEMPGSQAWINGYFSLYVVGHELGHNLGVHHASSLSCTDATGQRVSIGSTCTPSEYGDPFDVMGAAPRHTSNWHKAQYGWLAATNLRTVQASGTFTLAPQESPGGGIQLLRIPRGQTGDYYYLELRQRFGAYFDIFGAADPAVTGLTIRLCPDYGRLVQSQLIDTTPVTATFSDAPLAVGQTFSDPGYAISVTTAGLGASGATVQVQLGGVPPPPDTTAPSPPSARAEVQPGPAVALTWTGSTDDVGVFGYRVYRDGVEIAAPSTPNYADSTVSAGGTYTYTVRALDAAGNVSDASNPVRVVVASAAGGDRHAPRVRAFAGVARRGRAAPLRFRVFDESGTVTVFVRVLAHGRIVGRVRARRVSLRPKRINALVWRVPSSLRGRVRFCVGVWDRAGNAGAACAALRVR